MKETLQIEQNLADDETAHAPAHYHPEIAVRLALLNADIRWVKHGLAHKLHNRFVECADLPFVHRSAEAIYLDHGNVESALQMYKDLRRWDDAIKLADRRGYSESGDLLKDQMSFLLRTGQEEKAGSVLEARGDTDQAMTLYLKANQPTKAARLLLKSPQMMHDEQLFNRVTQSLVTSGWCISHFRVLIRLDAANMFRL